MDNMQILDRLVSIRINADERASVILKEDPGCNSIVTKAACLESGIKQLIIEIQNLVLAEHANENRSDDTSWGLLMDKKNESKNDDNQGKVAEFRKEQYVFELCDY